MSCNHIVYHPPVGSKQWNEVLKNLRETSDHGDGSVLPILAEQLFGECEAR